MIDIKELKDKVEYNINKTDKTIIVPHNGVDCDAIASSIGLSLIARKLKKDSAIVMNDSAKSIDSSIKDIIENEKKEFNIINLNKYSSIASKNDGFILSDVNKDYKVSVKEYLTNPDNIVIIDHHDPDKDTVKSNYKFIDSDYSSASEIVTQLLKEFKIKITPEIANYLYGGIYLDTSSFSRNIGDETFGTLQYLKKECKADPEVVGDMFAETIESLKIVNKLIEKVECLKWKIAIVAADEDEEYVQPQIAKAADRALRTDVDASFVIGKLDNGEVSISGRSKNGINISAIMSELGGGGNPSSGAAQFKDSSIAEVKNELVRILRPSYAINKNKEK